MCLLRVHELCGLLGRNLWRREGEGGKEGKVLDGQGEEGGEDTL